MLVCVSDIEWDVDEPDLDADTLGLPQEAVLDFGELGLTSVEDSHEIETIAIDKLSDQTGWCILGCSIAVLRV